MHRGTLFIAFFIFSAFLMLSGRPFAQMHDHSQMQSMNISGTAKPVVFVTTLAFKTQLDQVYNSYLSIHAALSSDEFQNTQSNALAFTKSFQEVDMKLLTDMKAHMAWMASSEKLSKDAKQIAAAPDIETARGEFKQASLDLIAIAKQFRTSGKNPLYVFHCPMAFNKKGADWVQDEKTVKNPYFGKSMLACGEITDIIGAKSGK